MDPSYEEIGIKKEKLEEHYDIKDELGRGQFAVVKKCVRLEDEIEVAAKYVKVKRSKSSRNGLSREAIQREAWILKLLNHEKVIKLYDIYDLGSEMVLVLELLSGGELFDKICELEYLTEVDACLYMKQVLEAIKHLHDNQIVHLDIKPENIVLKIKDSSEIKLVDFGLAQKLYPGHDLKEMMGTPEFVAPEIINYETIGFYTDMWAIGVLAYILLSGCSPFLGDNNQETYENIIKVDYTFEDEYFDTISDSAKEFVSSLLIKQPNKRNTVQQCLDHTWVETMSLPRERVNSSVIATNGFKAFVARRRWQQSFQKLNAITRFSKFLRKDGNLKPLKDKQSEICTPSPLSIETNERSIELQSSENSNNGEHIDNHIVTNQIDNSSKRIEDLSNQNENVHENKDTTDAVARSNSISDREFREHKTSVVVSPSTNKSKVKISITEAPEFGIKPRTKSLLDSPKHSVRKDSLASKLGPSQRRYSREDPVRYTEQIKTMISQRLVDDNNKGSVIEEEKETVSQIVDTKIDLVIDEKSSGGVSIGNTEIKKDVNDDIESKEIIDKNINDLKTNQINENKSKIENKMSTQQKDVDVDNIVAYDIRVNSEVKTSIRQKTTTVETDNTTESSIKSTRTKSISESRKAFILGSQTSTNTDGLVNLSKRRSLKLEANMLKSLQENKEIQIKLEEQIVDKENTKENETLELQTIDNTDGLNKEHTEEKTINEIKEDNHETLGDKTLKNESIEESNKSDSVNNNAETIRDVPSKIDDSILNDESLNVTETQTEVSESPTTTIPAEKEESKTPNGLEKEVIKNKIQNEAAKKDKKKKEKSSGCSCTLV